MNKDETNTNTTLPQWCGGSAPRLSGPLFGKQNGILKMSSARPGGQLLLLSRSWWKSSAHVTSVN